MRTVNLACFRNCILTQHSWIRYCSSKKYTRPAYIFLTQYLILCGPFPLLFLFCHTRGPAMPIGAAQIADAFVNQSPAFERALADDPIKAVKWDSCVKAAMKVCIGPAGTFAQSLIDSSGVEYTLGWKTPASIRPDTNYPLIVYLHGGTGTQLTTKGEKAYDMLSPLADSFKLFLASPSANRFTPWWSPQGIWRILQTLRFMTLRYPINPAKVFLAGVSDGATGCYAVANTACGPFAGFFAVSGFGGMLSQVSMDLIPTNIMQRPIYNVNAGKDRIYAIAQVKMFLDWLIARGARIEHMEYPYEEHGFDYRDKEFGALAGYIRNWAKPENKTGINWTFVPGFPSCADNLIASTLDNTAQSHFVNASLNNDTVSVNAEGIKEMIISFPDFDKKGIIVKTGKKTRKVRASHASALLSFHVMLHEGFPLPQASTCYRIMLPQQ